MKNCSPSSVLCRNTRSSLRSVFPRSLLLGACLLLSALAFAPTTEKQASATRQVEKSLSDLEVVYEMHPLTDAPAPRIAVEMRITMPEAQERVRLQMPVWSPGDYHYQNHGRFVQNVKASSGDASKAALQVAQEDANTWQVTTKGQSSIRVTYTVPNTPPGFFSENVRVEPEKGYAFVNGPAALMYVVGHKENKTGIRFQLAEGWKVEVPLPEQEGARGAETLFVAKNYDELADSPIVMARNNALVVQEFQVDGKKHRAVFFGNLPADLDAGSWMPMLKSIVQAEAKIMGGLPYPIYHFVFDVNGRGGGLEHTNSARLAVGGRPGRRAGFIAHEFFHLWNVKRIRPRVLGPFDYINPPKTRNLWFAEGVTEYYANIATRRAGLTSEANFLSHWADAIRWNLQNPARLKVSADESSLRVWEANNSTGYGGLSYYDKGELIGLCLDLKIRQVTRNRRSLDDVMRELFRRTNPPKPGYGEDEIREVVNEVAGQDLTDFYNLLARSTQEMPFAECLGYAGLDINGRPLPDATPAQLELRKNWIRSDL